MRSLILQEEYTGYILGTTDRIMIDDVKIAVLANQASIGNLATLSPEQLTIYEINLSLQLYVQQV